MNKCILLLLFFFAVILAAATDIRSDGSGIMIQEKISDLSFEVLSIDGKNLKKCNFPKEYSKAGLYPETEYYERFFYFSAPEGSDPRLEISINSSMILSNSELVPSQKFIKGNSGLISESYELPVKREDKESKNAEIVFFGQMNGMNLYKLLLRPMTIKNDQAVIATDIAIKIRFGKDFNNPKVDNPEPQDALEAAIINFEYAKNNPVSKKKAAAANFLDRQTEWVRVKIKDEGIYRISGASLSSSGLDISSALCSRIKVFSSAGKDIEYIPVDSIYPVYHGAKEISRKVVDSNGNGLFEDSDYIVFYGVQTTQRDPGKTAHYFNKYSENTFYWIDLGIGSQTDGKNPEILTSSASNYIDISVFQRHEYFETRKTLSYDGESFTWYNSKIDPLQSLSVDFSMKNIDLSYPVKLKVDHSTDVAGSNTPRIKYSINGNALTDTISYKSSFEADFKSMYFAPDSENSFRMTNIEVYNVEYDMTKYYNGFDIIYYGVVNSGILDEYFYAQLDSASSYRFNLGNSSGKEIYDISDPYNVRISNMNGDFCVITADKKFNSYVLFSGTYKTPVEIKIFDNSAVKSLHSRTVQADMVIISPSDFYDFFKNDETGYIQAHLDAGNDVASIEVVNIEEINNEFGRGYQEPAATRNFIKYAYDNWGTKYILLAGDGNYYIKNEQNIPEKNHIYTADPSFRSGSDDFYANLSSASYAQHVAVGRFTASNITELRNIVSKTISYIKNSNLSNKKSKILLVGDDERNPDFFSERYPQSGWVETVHINNTENSIFDIIPKYYYCDKLYLTEYPLEYSAATGLWLKPTAQDDLIRRLQSGVNVFCYVGHGAPMQLAHEKVFTPGAFSKISNYENYFFMIGATCSFGVFNNPGVKNLAEQMLISANKGSIGLINSVAPVYSGSNESLVGKIFYSAYFNPIKKLTIGEALRQGKNLEAGDNSECYMLIGDPALMFFNDKTIVESESSLELNTLVLDSISSSLNQAVSSGISDFNGVLNNTIFDSEVKRSYFNSEKWIDADGDSLPPLEYNLPGKIILSGISTINNGNSVAKFILPKDLTYGDNKGKVLFYGYNSYGQEFSGSIDSVSIRGDAEVTISDSIPPEIRICFNSLNYISGDPIGQSPLIFAEIFDENGINTSGGIGHKIMMEIDGTATDVTPYFTYDIDNYKKGHTSYQPVDLSEGKHIIKITAWDAFNNYNERTESFEVVKAADQQSNRIGNLLNYPNPVKNKGTTFGFAVDSQADLKSYSVTVYTISGRKVKVIDGTAVDPAEQFQQCFWDGKDADGDTPANGVYIYVLRAKFNTGDTINKKGKLIFAR